LGINNFLDLKLSDNLSDAMVSFFPGLVTVRPGKNQGGCPLILAWHIIGNRLIGTEKIIL